MHKEMDVTKELYQKTRITATAEEQAHFCNKYIRTLQVKITEGGTLELEIQK